MSAKTNKRARLEVAAPTTRQSRLPWAGDVTGMILAYLWVYDWQCMERVCCTLRRHVLQYVRRFPPWHAVRRLLPPKTHENAHSAWVRSMYERQDTLQATAKWPMYKDVLELNERHVWNRLHNQELTICRWRGARTKNGQPVRFNDDIIWIRVDMCHATAADLHDLIAQQWHRPLAPNGRLTWHTNSHEDGKGWANLSFRDTTPLWSSHPTVKSFEHLCVAFQSEHVPDTTVLCTLGRSVYPVLISLDDTFETLEHYLAAVGGQVLDLYFTVQGKVMDTTWSLRRVGVKPNDIIRICPRLR